MVKGSRSNNENNEENGGENANSDNNDKENEDDLNKTTNKNKNGKVAQWKNKKSTRAATKRSKKHVSTFVVRTYVHAKIGYTYV